MSILEVPGAKLHYEAVGKGPMLLCISGADGSCEIWRGFAEMLKEHFTVVSWDRRGFSRSYLHGAQDYEHRIETDVDDAARIIKHISGAQPATVIGNSSGAIVALKLVIIHPQLIRTLISYEPPAAKVLPDFDAIWAAHEDIYATYRRAGMAPAFDKFADLTQSDKRMMARLLDFSTNPYMSSNMQYWFEREFMDYPKTDFDIDRELRPLKDKLMLLNGEASPQGGYQYRANVVIGEKLTLPLTFLPGEHVAHATHAKEFSAGLLEALKKKDSFYQQI